MIILELELRVSFKSPCGCWELNLGLLEEQPFPLIASPASPLYIYSLYIIYIMIYTYDIYHKYFRQCKGTEHIEAPIHGM